MESVCSKPALGTPCTGACTVGVPPATFQVNCVLHQIVVLSKCTDGSSKCWMKICCTPLET